MVSLTCIVDILSLQEIDQVYFTRLQKIAGQETKTAGQTLSCLCLYYGLEL